MWESRKFILTQKNHVYCENRKFISWGPMEIHKTYEPGLVVSVINFIFDHFDLSSELSDIFLLNFELPVEGSVEFSLCQFGLACLSNAVL